MTGMHKGIFFIYFGTEMWQNSVLRALNVSTKQFLLPLCNTYGANLTKSAAKTTSYGKVTYQKKAHIMLFSLQKTIQFWE